MKNTSELSVLGDFSMPEDTLVIHPNDGFDLGLMTTSHPVYIYRGLSLADFKEQNGDRSGGKLLLKNECRLGSVEISTRVWEKLGKPKRVQLYYDEPNILIWVPPQKET